MNRVLNWFKHQFSNPQVLFLAFILLGLILAISYAENTFAPVFAGVVIAYLLEGLVGFLERHKVMRFVAVLIVFIAFMAFLLFVIFALLPLLSRQATQLIQQLPSMVASGRV